TIDDDTATVVAHTSSDVDEDVRDVNAVEDVDVTVEEVDVTVEEVDVAVEEVDVTVEEVDVTVEDVDEVAPVVQNQATIATPRDVPTLEISQALEAENEVDNSHWVSAMEVVLQKLKQAPSETIGQSDHDSALPLRNAS
ncbi:MAG: hypothetical protein O7F71_09720, partial [Gammaproteobacteria bacterium]|nr:hypothetical protein [Gammaproteobacteria bacterium]